MRRLLEIDPRDATPIWHQIEEGIRRLVASAALAPGQAVPSVRELARELMINPATVAKAYQRLCDAGVLAVRRGEGTFVAERPRLLPKSERLRELRDAAARYAGVVRTLGADEDEAVEQLRAVLARFGRDRAQGQGG